MPIVLPPRSPNLNAYGERFVRSIKEEALERMVTLSERSLHYAMQQYLAPYHTERNHQGLDHQLIVRGGLGCYTGTVVGGSGSMDRSPPIIARPRDVTQYFNHTG